jgi:hypothetical protein
LSGIARSETVTPRASTSVRHGARPVTTTGSDSSTCREGGTMRVVTSTRDSPSSSSSKPIRLNALSAFGLAKVTTPSTSMRIRPSEARGAPRRGEVGADRSGNSPPEIIRNRSSAASLKVICCREGVRASPRFVCRVSTPTGRVRWPSLPRVRTMGTALTLVGVSSNQSGFAESTISVVSKAPCTWVRHCGRTRSPTMSR